MKKSKRPNCIKCKFFTVTWDPKKPYGCKAIGFKGKAMPSTMVRRTSGKDCLLFQEKQKKNKS